jgi:hypothetical protein
MTLLDRSFSYGIQNFMYCNQYVNIATGDDYTYVVYMDRKGEVLISRFNAAGDEGRYFVTSGDYATIVASLHQYTIDNLFVLPNQVTDQTL